MALEVRRIVSGHDANGKAVVATDERLTAVPRLNRPHIAGCEIWSTDRMPVDNSADSAAAQRGTMHAWVNNGSTPAVFAFILIDAEPAAVDGQPLHTHYPAP